MKNICRSMLLAGTLAMLLNGCAGDSYNSGYNRYDNRSSYDRQMDNEARKDVAEASRMLSDQDIKNLENMK